MYGHAIARARERAGLSQREVCKAIGISQGYLGGIETGRNDPGVLHLIVELAKVYRCGINQLLGVPNAGELAIQEIKDLFDRLSLERQGEVMEIIKLFLLIDSQEYRTQVLEDLITTSDLFGNGRVLSLLIAARESSKVARELAVDDAGLPDNF